MLKGYKTYAAATALLIMALNHKFHFVILDETMLMQLAMGVGLFGLGHKGERILRAATELINALTEPAEPTDALPTEAPRS